MIRLYPFNIDFSLDGQGQPLYAAFPFIFDKVPAAGISCALSSRFAGDMVYSEQNQARRSLFEKLGLEASRVFGLTQIHSRDVVAVDRRHPADVPADGLVSIDRGIALLVLVADCLPVYLYDTETGAFGLLHSGWRGTGIALRALELMGERFSTRPEAVAAVLGPCIGSCCYKVNEERAFALEKEFGPLPPGLAPEDAALMEPVTRREEGPEGIGWFLDLKAANIRLLAGAGVRNIAVCGDCTFTDDRLGSFRREGEKYTRMAALVYGYENC